MANDKLDDRSGCEVCLMGDRSCWRHDKDWTPTKGKVKKRPRGLYPGNPQGYDENCVICQNEGMHNLDERPHVMEGTE